MKEKNNLNLKILNELSTDAKVPLRKLASKLKVSFVTVLNRIKKLEKEGIIEGYFTKINFEKLDYDINVIIEIKIAKGKLFELEKKIAKSNEVWAVYDTTGEYDATVFARFKTTRLMDNFLKKIQTLDFVERTNTKLILNTVKESQTVL
ncbi:Lrp/AsnC family transcriptional regulator [Nanoarchaeota archaeon]